MEKLLDNRLIYSLDEVGKMLGRHEKTVYRMIDAGQIEACVFRGRTHIKADALREFIESLPTRKGGTMARNRKPTTSPL